MKIKFDMEELSLRALLCGGLIGALVAGINIYMGLKSGITINGSLIAALFSYWLFHFLRPKEGFSLLEANIAQTAGSAMGSMASTAGLLAAIPAMKMLGFHFSFWQLMAWTLSVAYVGLCFSIPLRKQILVDKNLRFPTGTATAETLLDFFGRSKNSVKKLKALMTAFAAAALVALIGVIFPRTLFLDPFSFVGIASMGTFGFLLYSSPMLVGVGLFIGRSVGASIFIGTVIAWGLLGPLAVSMGWVQSASAPLRAWVLWPGVAMMAAASFANLAYAVILILRTKRYDEAPTVTEPWVLPKATWAFFMGAALLALVITSKFCFAIPPLVTLLAVVISYGLAMVAGRTVGESDFNPSGGLAKVTQVLFAGIVPGSMTTNLMAASITAAGASQSGDMLQDLKAGSILGANPRRQFIAQCVGILMGACIVVPIYLVFDNVYTIGEGPMSAPAARAWKTMAVGLNSSAQSLSQASQVSIVIAALIGFTLTLGQRLKPKLMWWPSSTSMGLAFLVPAYYGVTVALGSLILALWMEKSPTNCKSYSYAIAVGLILGEGSMGLLSTFFSLLTSIL